MTVRGKRSEFNVMNIAQSICGVIVTLISSSELRYTGRAPTLKLILSEHLMNLLAMRRG